MDVPSPALAAARRLARRAACSILPVDVGDVLAPGHDGTVLLCDREPGEALLSRLAAALPRVEALVLWVPDWDVETAADALGRHGFEHGSVNGVDMPTPGVLAVLTCSEARADAHADALAARERPFRALAVMPAYNEGDVIGPAIGALISAGVDVYLLDHRSTDDTVAAATPWLGRGLVGIERFPDESGPGFDERNGDVMVWRDILRRVEQVTGEVSADWYLFVNADEFRESPWPGVTLLDGLREVDELGFNAVNFDLVNFRPTPQDAFVPGSDVRDALRFYEEPGPYDLLQVKAWKAQPTGPVNLSHHGGHDVIFDGKRVFPVPFVLRHYPIRSAEHGRRKVVAERLGRFDAQERAGGWHVQYDHYGDDADYLHDRATLTMWDGDAFRAAMLARTLRQQLLLAVVAGRDVASEPVTLDGLAGWLDRRGHGTLGATEIERMQQHLLSRLPAGPDLEAAAEDLGAVAEAQARARAEMKSVAALGAARAARRSAA
ncbi:MAG TPA: glycosyltransferase family A protein [Baekduia sp.]|nr:glycosyltransferase family A protein [Baekduia sp.]